MIEFEAPQWWEIPLCLLSIPFVIVSVVCGYIAAIITGHFHFRVTTWKCAP